MPSSLPNLEDRAPLRHVAIIMDGNGRWAKARRLPRAAGHRQGVAAVRRTVAAAIELDIPYLTLFGFSAENWRRPPPEIAELMRLLRRFLRSYLAEMHQNGVRLRVIGELSRLPDETVALIRGAEQLTAENTTLNLMVALSYGGRQEITQMARRLGGEVAAGRLDPEQIDEAAVAACLETVGVPDPDLLIRTSGEKRLSNFLLWQVAYAELIFVDTLWPDFGRDDLEDAIREYRRRERRYGSSVGSA